MRPDYSNKWLACRPFNTEQVSFAVIHLDRKVRAELVKVSEAWQAAATVYGNRDVHLNVHENFVYWVSGLPTLWADFKITNNWSVMEVNNLAALAFAGSDGKIDELLAGSLLEWEVVMGNSLTVAMLHDRVQFEGSEKYGANGDVITPQLPKEVMDWVLG